MIKNLMIGIEAIIIHLLLFVIERISVDPARIFLLLPVTEILHGLCSPQILAVSVSFKPLGIIL
jgi:hypothetical protein